MPCRALRLLLALVLLAAPAASAQRDAVRELLRDGDFEKSGKASSPGWTHIWPPSFRPEPDFGYPTEGMRTGKRCAEIAVVYAGGFTSLTQELDVRDELGWVRFSAWTKLVDGSDGGSAWLILAFIGRDLSDTDMRQSRRVMKPGDWEELALECAVPEGTTRILVRCGVFGPGRARFDDVTLTGGEGDLPPTDVALVVAHGTWRVEAHETTADGTLDVSVPFPFAAQTPLAIRVDADPSGSVKSLAVVAERENRPLRIRFGLLPKGRGVKLHVQTLFLVRRRDLSDGKDVDLATSKQVPEELREFLLPAAGIESEHESIRKLARAFGKEDLATVVADLFGFLRREITGGSGDQGALATLESKDAACTGHANLGAALLIAAGVPTRVLACVLVGAEQQEHYVVESWTKALGWARVETTVKLFPVPDAMHAILRVVYPDSERSAGNVPLFWRASEGLRGDPDFGVLGKASCWQSAQELKQLTLDRAELDALEAAARAAFEALVTTPASGESLSLVPQGMPEALQREVDVFLAP